MGRAYARNMNELNEVWAQMIDDALKKASASGNGDVAEYLTLKATNDKIRQASVEWLLGSMLEIASFANQNGAGITIENENPHQFSFKNANLVGWLVRFVQGVRCLTAEAGWTRTPTDGFMRGGALACAKISHFGVSRHNAELFLINTNDFPNWFSIDENGKKDSFDSRHLNQHFRLFLGES
jgi:hypothetical protein